MFDLVTFEKLLEDLKSFGQWYQSKFGISIQGSRVEGIIRLIEKLEEAKRNNRLQEVIDEEGVENLYIPLFDAGSFSIVREAFSEFKLGVLRKRDLREIIKGPLNPSDEEDGTEEVTPRNKLFELSLAALIHNADIEVVGFDDIQVILNSRNIFIECKRLGSKNEIRIKNNLIEASSQLDKKLKIPIIEKIEG